MIRAEAEILIARNPETIAARFWSKVNRNADGCWIWTACCFKTAGYGGIGLRGRLLGAHRVAWLLTYGEIPPGMQVLHKCDANYPPGDISYRRCVRPDHLYLGDRSQNMADMTDRGRAATGDRNGTHLHPEHVLRGEENGWSRLTEEQVTEIRLRYTAGGVFQRELAAEYGVDQTQISHIVLGKQWAHLSVPSCKPKRGRQARTYLAA